MLSVFLFCIPNIWPHSEPSLLLAAFFCTMLASLAGKFGFFAGVIASALHLSMVMHCRRDSWLYEPLQ
jgi:hypothetical protein